MGPGGETWALTESLTSALLGCDRKMIRYGKCQIAEQEQISKSHLFLMLAEEIHDRDLITTSPISMTVNMCCCWISLSCLSSSNVKKW